MILDSSAIVAILQGEHEAIQFAKAISQSKKVLIAAPTYLECCMVLGRRRGLVAQFQVDEYLSASRAEIVAFTSEATLIAVQAFFKYGKGQGHPAQLNFGDCMSYAVSKLEMMPLLFKGDDFRHTDVVAAV